MADEPLSLDDDRSFLQKASDRARRITRNQFVASAMVVLTVALVVSVVMRKREVEAAKSTGGVAFAGGRGSGSIPGERLIAPYGRATVGSVDVLITSASVDGDSIWITVASMTRDGSKKSSVGEWAEYALLKDDLGNGYHHRPFDVRQHAMMQVLAEQRGTKVNAGPGPIYSDLSRAEILDFEKPVRDAKHLDLTLDAKTIGGSGQILFRIPRDMWMTPASKSP